MPAAVLPFIEVDNSIRVRHTDRWMIGCPDCNWYPDPYFVDEIAKRDAFQHNEHFHDGIGVTITLDMPIQLAQQKVDELRKRARFAWWWTLGYAFMLTGLALLLVGPFFSLSTLTWGLLLSLYARQWGVADERLRHERWELLRLRAAFLPPEDNEGKQL